MSRLTVMPGKMGIDPWGRLAVQAVTDEEAFTRLYEHFFPRVYQFLLKKTRDSYLADELVESAFLRMYEHLSQYDPEKGAFSTWLFRIAKNVVSSHFASKAVTMQAPWDDAFDPAAPAEENPEKQALSKERQEELHEAIMQLPERQRQILEMTYWLEMKSNEIAAQLGMAPSSVRVALKQARERLRELLKE
ncbi:RNA polymerase sigma-70 factor, ECF subfamily [Selenomonas sp. GACV-9]|uniref:RNA polymerase sigma factor n=1 Tax=Selenomonas sp. GACV-9 TaxID=3158782 RepID=UPI0008E808A8|nr:RNA polymerase sigma-70 factor, ECF subfamily [Selenomonas ruminantium]